MRGALLALLFAAGIGGCDSGDRGAAPAAVATTGTLEGAPYRIEIPADWNGDLVVYAHGYERVGLPRREPMPRDAFDRWALARGLAVARSGYSRQGWAVAEALADSERLRLHFVAAHGRPRHTFLVGHSLGAHIALATLERHSDAYAGVLALCGINAPASEMLADAVVAPLSAFDAAFPGVLGLAAGGLADPASPATADAAAIEAALQRDEAKAAQLASAFAIPRDGLARGLVQRYGLLRELQARAGDQSAIEYAAANAPLRGDARKPVVVLSNHDDETVPPAISGRYAELAAAAGHGDHVLTLPPTGHGHCDFAPADVDRAFTVLVDWVATGTRPSLRR